MPKWCFGECVVGRQLLVQGKTVEAEIRQNAAQRRLGFFSVNCGPKRGFGTLIRRLRDVHGWKFDVTESVVATWLKKAAVKVKREGGYCSQLRM